MARYLVVGSGATGVHLAQTLLERGETVELLDVGYQRPPAQFPDTDFAGLKERLDDGGRYFLGDSGEGVVYPGPDAKPYGFPPSKGYVFRRPPGVRLEERGFAPLVSFARGGLAEAWTGGCYELLDEEFADFPFDPRAIRPHYATVASRIGISATDDDLRAFSPVTADYLASLPADVHSTLLLERYQARRDALNDSGFVLGRSRVAVLSRDQAGRQRCANLGRCLWGCPRGSLYAPSHTLADLLTRPGFTYRPGFVVRRVLVRGDGEAVGVAATADGTSGEVEFRAERVVLAAGALATSGIYLQTLASVGRTGVALGGLMDNRQVMVPFLSLGRVGAPVELASYQFHMLALGLRGENWRSHAHGQISTLKAAAVHPIVAALPFDLKTSLAIFRRIRGGLGVANVWLPDSRRPGNVARLATGTDGAVRLVLEYADHEHDRAAGQAALGATRAALGRLGCVVPRGMARLLPRGSSVHYAGTLPMMASEQEHTTGVDGAVRGFRGLYVADGAGFPWLPAKNLTYTLMANAVRLGSLID